MQTNQEIILAPIRQHTELYVPDDAFKDYMARPNAVKRYDQLDFYVRLPHVVIAEVMIHRDTFEEFGSKCPYGTYTDFSFYIFNCNGRLVVKALVDSTQESSLFSGDIDVSHYFDLGAIVNQMFQNINDPERPAHQNVNNEYLEHLTEQKAVI